MAFGARMAGGCTSGHGISGALQAFCWLMDSVDMLFYRRSRNLSSSL